MKQLETLEAFKCARALSRSGYRLTLKKPLDRHFGLADQIRRAGISIPANMVEGYALGTTSQFVRCLRISLGSVAELKEHLETARDMDLVAQDDSGPVIALAVRTIRLIVGLLRRLESRRGSPFPLPHSPFPFPHHARAVRIARVT